MTNEQNFYSEPSKNIPIYGNYDVVVVGGGCAGFTAAVAAGRLGAKTLIIERFPFFGGTATASLMADIVGIRNQVEPEDLQVMKGIGEELLLRLQENGGAHSRVNEAYKAKQHSDTKGDLSYSYAFNTEAFKAETLRMVVESGCEILFHAWFSDVITEGNTLKGILVETKSGRQAIFSKVFIDATGDGDVAARAGAAFMDYKMDGENCLQDCLMYKVSGFEPGFAINCCTWNGEMVIWGPDAGKHNSVDARELTAMEVDSRLSVYRHFDEMKKKDPALKNATITETGPLLGIRQTRFIKGEYIITGDDVIEGRMPEDSIAMAANPVIHYYGYRRFLKHDGYGIPYRTLIPETLDGLLIAGRCISSDQVAYESWRAMSTVLCIGEAAGTAAALSAKEAVQPRELDVSKLQAQLIAQGAEIGQNKK